ncbi:MAG: hypothetical protein DSY50_07100 [Desulfobulbus sp.]|nr:MAG: hypothetical protein DSY50_07100 [Desulfobulbus sp.]
MFFASFPASTRRNLPAYTCLLMAALLLLFSTPAFASSAGDKAMSNPTSQAEEQYKAAKDVYFNLKRTPAQSQSRAQWLKGILPFRKIYLAAPQSNLAPSCLYMIGRMYRQMYERFKVPLDIDESINYFNDVASKFPGSSLADDALFIIAEIELSDKNNPEQAAHFFQEVTSRYPNGDKSNQAYSQLQAVADRHNLKLPEKTVTEQIGHDLVNLQPVQHWSSSDYTRIAVRASEPVHYSTRLLEMTNDQPRQLWIDFDQSYIPPEARSPLSIEDGLLKQVAAEQYNETTVRLILDIESIADYKVFNLNDPFRVIIDVRGEKKKQAKAAPQESVLQEIKPPEKAPAPVVVKPAETVKTAKRGTLPGPEVYITLEDRKKVKPTGRVALPSGTKKTTRHFEQNSLSLAQQLGLGIHRIVIDPGHGGKDPGAMANHLQEKDIVLSVARRTAKILRKKYNYEVILTRERDVFIPLEERTAIANTKNADLFVSIHVNAHPKKTTRGVETFYLNLATNTEAMRVAARENATSTHNISEMQDILSDLMQNAKIKESSRLAEAVQSTLVNGMKQHHFHMTSLGVKQAPFYVLIGAEMPAVLAEISFITNPEEAKLLKDVNYLQAIAEEIAAGVANYSIQRRTAAL